jgi:Spy/CpxP family protein refolding chaperone
MKTKMKNLKVSLLILAIAASTVTFAQKEGTPPPPPSKKEKRNERQEERKENIEAMKVGFITKKLDLTSEEAQKFWPVYNQYSDKIQEVRKKRRMDNRETKQKFDELSDKEVEAAVDNEMGFRQKELDIQKEYHSKFKSVLPIKKVAKLYAAEEQFKMELLNKLRDKEHKQPPPPKDKE